MPSMLVHVNSIKFLIFSLILPTALQKFSKKVYKNVLLLEEKKDFYSK